MFLAASVPFPPAPAPLRCAAHEQRADYSAPSLASSAFQYQYQYQSQPPLWGAGPLRHLSSLAMPTPPQFSTPSAQPETQPPTQDSVPAFNFSFSTTSNTSHNPLAIPTSQAEQSTGITDASGLHFLPTTTTTTFSFASVPAPTSTSSWRRESKFAPLLKRANPEEERRKRRDAYMTNVRERRDVARWETRGESSLQRDFFAEQRAWEQEQARLAEEACLPNPDEDTMEDQMAMEDDAFMHTEPEPAFDDDEEVDWWANVAEETRSSYDSDDEYEALMLEIAAQAENMQQQQQQQQLSDPSIGANASIAQQGFTGGSADANATAAAYAQDGLIMPSSLPAEPSQGMDMS